MTSASLILMADDDDDDRELARDAFARTHLDNELRFVEDGEQLLDYLKRRGAFGDRADAPRPGLILLDLNMPGIGGAEALRLIKEDPALRRIPIVVLTTSAAADDVCRSYDLGASSYIRKPSTFPELVSLLEDLGGYWFGVVALPPASDRG
jgi:CheY-like chemotaxis protein